MSTLATSPHMSPTPTDPLAEPTPRGGGGLTAATGGGVPGALHPAREILSLQGFALSERRMAAALGLPVRQLATARTRHGRRGVDWELADNDIGLAEKSLPALTAALGLTLTEAELAALAEKSRRDQLPAVVMAKVLRWPLNRHLVTVAYPNGDGAPHTVDLVVNHREYFKLGMAVPIRKNAAGKFELARRAPRAKGRW